MCGCVPSSSSGSLSNLETSARDSMSIRLSDRVQARVSRSHTNTGKILRPTDSRSSNAHAVLSCVRASAVTTRAGPAEDPTMRRSILALAAPCSFLPFDLASGCCSWTGRERCRPAPGCSRRPSVDAARQFLVQQAKVPSPRGARAPSCYGQSAAGHTIQPVRPDAPGSARVRARRGCCPRRPGEGVACHLAYGAESALERDACCRRCHRGRDCDGFSRADLRGTAMRGW